MDLTPYLSKYRKRIIFNYSKQTLFFDANMSLFSSLNVDKGSFQLIDSLRKNKEINYGSILDVGCGYGAIGITLKKLNPKSEVELTDRSVLAVEFAKHNAEINNLTVKAYPGLDYQEVKNKFDLICCNYPAKAGLNALKTFVWNSSNFLNKKGILAIVIVKELEEDFKSIMREEMNILFEEKYSGHIVYHISFNKEIKQEEEAYLRQEAIFPIEDEEYWLETAYNLDEFSSPSFETEALIKLLKLNQIQNLKLDFISILEPLQGHAALAVMRYLKPGKITILSQDILSLKYSELNLRQNNFKNITAIPSISIESQGDLLIWRVDEAIEFPQFQFMLQEAKKSYKKIILAGKKSNLSRFFSMLNLSPKFRKEKKNCAAYLI